MTIEIGNEVRDSNRMLDGMVKQARYTDPNR